MRNDAGGAIPPASWCQRGQAGHDYGLSSPAKSFHPLLDFSEHASILYLEPQSREGVTPTMADYRELLKGSLDLIVLALIEREPMYGYQMVKEIHARSTGALQMKEGSLYPALHRLERAGLIESSWQRRTDGVDRRYYRLTTHGLEALAARRTTWTSFVAAIEGVLGDGRASAI